jgi:hypothetical protein
MSQVASYGRSPLAFRATLAPTGGATSLEVVAKRTCACGSGRCPGRVKIGQGGGPSLAAQDRTTPLAFRTVLEREGEPVAEKDAGRTKGET